jgi:hypothetical protein
MWLYRQILYFRVRCSTIRRIELDGIVGTAAYKANEPSQGMNAKKGVVCQVEESADSRANEKLPLLLFNKSSVLFSADEAFFCTEGKLVRWEN